jgi:hypothetical protein
MGLIPVALLVARVAGPGDPACGSRRRHRARTSVWSSSKKQRGPSRQTPVTFSGVARFLRIALGNDGFRRRLQERRRQVGCASVGLRPRQWPGVKQFVHHFSEPVLAGWCMATLGDGRLAAKIPKPVIAVRKRVSIRSAPAHTVKGRQDGEPDHALTASRGFNGSPCRPPVRGLENADVLPRDRQGNAATC